MIVVKDKNAPKKKYLMALSAFPNPKGFCHRTVLLYATDPEDARSLAKHLNPRDYIGEPKEVFY